ncbi:hypothetical protein HY030_02000 [Candidatus Gottesmanbacteria bacterium]|nr:hypothetical protein [Candidatus Gottesmanbacteria bacterium]
MTILSTALLIFPEFFYIKDIYPQHYRANTMFKLGYQAFIMLSLASGYIIFKLFSLKPLFKKLSLIKGLILNTYYLILFVLLFLVLIYPYFSVNSYFNGLKVYKGLYGLSYLQRLYFDDYQAIFWLNQQTERPIIIEAVGESYTDYSRVSANTGLSTVLGWPVHEWLWRGGYDEAGKRVEEVKKIYTSSDLLETKNLLSKYNVKLVFVGLLEHQKYPGIKEEKFNKLGRIIFQSGNTKIYELTF